MAHRGDRLGRGGEFLDDGDHARVQAQVLGGASAGDHQRVIFGHVDIVEAGVEREQMPRLFGVGLVAFEVVNRGFDGVAGPLAGADSVHRVPHHLQRLERHHGLVVFRKVARQKQNFLSCHGMSFRERVK